MGSVAPDLTGLLPAETESAAMTRDLGRRLAPLLPDGAVLALRGDLGAGKTVLVSGLVEGMGGDPLEVTSPTFSIAQEYPVEGGFLLHVDAYRTRNEREFVEMGLDEYLERARLSAVEWPDKLGTHLPEDALVLTIEHLAEGRRRITIALPR